MQRSEEGELRKKRNNWYKSWGRNGLCLWRIVRRPVWVQSLLSTYILGAICPSMSSITIFSVSLASKLFQEFLIILLAPSLCPIQFTLNSTTRVIFPEWFHHVTSQSRSSNGSLLQLSPSFLHKDLLDSSYAPGTFLGSVHTLMHNECQVPALRELMLLKNRTDTKQMNKQTNIKIISDKSKCQEENLWNSDRGGDLRCSEVVWKIWNEDLFRSGTRSCQGPDRGPLTGGRLLWEVSPAHQGNEPPLPWVTKAQCPYFYLSAFKGSS